MLVRYYGQSWYKYWIRIVICVLICRNLCESWMEGWSDLHTGYTKVHMSITQDGSNKKLGRNLTCFRNKYKYR